MASFRSWRLLCFRLWRNCLLLWAHFDKLQKSTGFDSKGHDTESDLRDVPTSSKIVLFTGGEMVQVDQLEGSVQHIVSWCGEEFDGSHLRLNSKFGLSPFAIILTHADAPLGSVLKLYSAVRNCSEEDKSSMWFKHNHPTELEIKGGCLQVMFASITNFNKNVVKAIGRLFHSMDDELFSMYKEKRFRHFLPPEFAEMVLAGTEFTDPGKVSEMFVGYHVTYEIGECKLILAPVYLDWTWSLYVWNFERKTIIVIDPVKMVGGCEVVMRIQGETVDKLHTSMTKWKDQLFEQPDISMLDWQREFLSVEGASGDRSTSGLYSMLYARYFDGKTLTRILTYESQDIQKCNILHQLVSIPDNVGDLPFNIRSALVPAA